MKVKVKKHGTYDVLGAMLLAQSVRDTCEETYKELVDKRDRLGRLIKRLEDLHPKTEGFVERITTLQDKREKWRKMGPKKRGKKLRLPYPKRDREDDKARADEARDICKRTDELLAQLKDPYIKLISQAAIYEQVLKDTEDWQYKEMSSVIH